MLPSGRLYLRYLGPKLLYSLCKLCTFVLAYLFCFTFVSSCTPDCEPSFPIWENTMTELTWMKCVNKKFMAIHPIFKIFQSGLDQPTGCSPWSHAKNHQNRKWIDSVETVGSSCYSDHKKVNIKLSGCAVGVFETWTQVLFVGSGSCFLWKLSVQSIFSFWWSSCRFYKLVMIQGCCFFYCSFVCLFVYFPRCHIQSIFN